MNHKWGSVWCLIELNGKNQEPKIQEPKKRNKIQINIKSNPIPGDIKAGYFFYLIK